MRQNPFASLAPTPAVHFKLYFYAAVLHLINQVVRICGSQTDALEQFPFLASYNNELAGHGLEGLSYDQALIWWEAALREWEAGVAGHLPLRALRAAAGLEHADLTLLVGVGLVEEDTSFGALVEMMQSMPGQHRPTVGLLNAWWSPADGHTAVQASIRHLHDLGLLEIVNPDAPRVEWALQVPRLLWDALTGMQHAQVAPWARYRPPAELIVLDDLIVPDPIRQRLELLPALLAAGEAQALVVRGPHHNGRRTLLGAVARALGRGVLEIDGLSQPDDLRWRLVGPLATVLGALPVIGAEPGSGEMLALPQLNGYAGPLGVVAGRQGGLSGPQLERAVALTLELPDAGARREHWQAALGACSARDLDALEGRFRMTGGNIRRAARLAQSYAALAGHSTITPDDVQQAGRALNRQALDTLAAHVPVSGDWSLMAVCAETQRELRNLEIRCRHRERLHTAVGPALSQLNAGVRALFSGPSGTGKTLAARLLAAALQMDLYRLDLSAVVNKYIGETEKNLNRIFAHAEELDIILLLDEGDALLTQRTSVHSSNDRYANLETNYLLQRIEAFEGILLITTNASDRIDSAFQRRLDLVIDFRPPDADERRAIWQLHLPANHLVDPAFLREVAGRCTLTGGQIRNAALHASVLALDDCGLVLPEHIEAAVQREYRKLGAICPLRVQYAREPVAYR